MQWSEIVHKQLGVLVKQKSEDRYRYLSTLMPREEVYQAKDWWWVCVYTLVPKRRSLLDLSASSWVLLQFATARCGQFQQKQYTFERNALRSSLRYHPHLQIWFIRLMWRWRFSLASQMLLYIGTCHLTFQPHESVLVRWVFCTSLQLWVKTPVEMCVSLLFWYQQLQILFGFRFNCCYNL